MRSRTTAASMVTANVPSSLVDGDVPEVGLVSVHRAQGVRGVRVRVHRLDSHGVGVREDDLAGVRHRFEIALGTGFERGHLPLAGERIGFLGFRDNPTADNLIGLLPLTLGFNDLNGVEKHSVLPRRLTMAGVPEGDEPEPQDIGYYDPSGALVFYGDVGYWKGIVRLGVFDSDLAALGARSGPFTATIELAG